MSTRSGMAWAKLAQKSQDPSLNRYFDRDVLEQLHLDRGVLPATMAPGLSSFSYIYSVRNIVFLIQNVLPGASFSMGYVSEEHAEQDSSTGWWAQMHLPTQYADLAEDDGIYKGGHETPALALCEVFCLTMALIENG